MEASVSGRLRVSAGNLLVSWSPVRGRVVSEDVDEKRECLGSKQRIGERGPQSGTLERRTGDGEQERRLEKIGGAAFGGSRTGGSGAASEFFFSWCKQND